MRESWIGRFLGGGEFTLESGGFTGFQVTDK